MGDRPRVLIIALSGRALAASARRAGFAPLVADLFEDDDTRATAQRTVRIEAGPSGAIVAERAFAALEHLAGAEPVEGIVYGGGLEDAADLIAASGERWGLIGNNAGTVERVKDPSQFALLCRACAVPHPNISMTRPASPAGWLAKRRGGTGGRHIQPAAAIETDDPLTYFQRRVSGRSVSALFLADGRDAHVLGFSEQWTSPAPASPYRYGGAVQPADLHPKTALELAGAVRRMAAQVPLLGLNSADFLVADDAAWCLEINPRPGATLDLFESRAKPLFRLHVDACRGQLPSRGAELPSGAVAACVVFSDAPIAAFPRLRWPDWACDRQPAGSSVAKHDPICTLAAHAPTRDQALVLLRARTAAVKAELYGRAA